MCYKKGKMNMPRYLASTKKVVQQMKKRNAYAEIHPLSRAYYIYGKA